MKRVIHARKLTKAIKAIGYYGDNGPYGGWVGNAESSLHEFCHSEAMGGGVAADDIDSRCREMSPRKSDWNEIKALALGKLVADRIGLRVSVRVLADYASANMRTKITKHGIRRRVERIMRARGALTIAERMATQILSRLK